MYKYIIGYFVLEKMFEMEIMLHNYKSHSQRKTKSDWFLNIMIIVIVFLINEGTHTQNTWVMHYYCETIK